MVGISLIPAGTGYDIDLRIKQDGSGKITQGICLAETTKQNQAMILVAKPSEFKEHPAIGVGLQDIIYDHDIRGWRKRIREQIEADGQRISKLELTAEGLTLEAEYK